MLTKLRGFVKTSLYLCIDILYYINIQILFYPTPLLKAWTRGIIWHFMKLKAHSVYKVRHISDTMWQWRKFWTHFFFLHIICICFSKKTFEYKLLSYRIINLNKKQDFKNIIPKADICYLCVWFEDICRMQKNISKISSLFNIFHHQCWYSVS